MFYSSNLVLTGLSESLGAVATTGAGFPWRSLKNKKTHTSDFIKGQLGLYFFAFFFWSKMCVLCMFYVDWELGGR